MPRPTSRSYLIPHILRAVRAPRATVRYPFAPLEIPDSYRGLVVVEIDRCRACGQCARACPVGCLQVERLEGRGVRLRVQYDRCAACGECERACRFGAIHLEAAFRPGATERDLLQVEWVRQGPPVEEDGD